MSISNDKASTAGEIALPAANYKLYCWKVRNGSAVRAGETIALAIRKDTSTTASTIASVVEPTKEAADAPSKHKRATKRRRPGVNPTTETMKSDESNGIAASKDADFTSAEIESKDSTEQQVAIVAQTDGILSMGPRHSKGGIEVIGSIEVCFHPTVVDGLCAVCGKATGPTDNTLSSDSNGDTAANGPQSANTNSDDNNRKMSRVTVSGLTVTVSDAEGRRMAQHDKQRLIKQQKLSLVLDLDHTLVHATSDVRARQHLGREDVRSLVLSVLEEPTPHQQQMYMQHFVKIRPHVKEFLEGALSLYEIGVYTMGTRHYAENICMLLSRHMVGANCDQVDLEHLRHRVAHLEAEVEREERSKAYQADQMKKASDEVFEHAALKPSSDSELNGSTPLASDDVVMNGSGEDTTKATGSNGEERHGKKRKHVTFEELPPNSRQKTEHKTSADHLEELKLVLDEAERMERLAVVMRNRLFGSRVVSRTDVVDLGRDVKSLKRIFPCGGTMAAVVDDREDVWANAGDINSARRGDPPENLLIVRPYHWGPFVGFADVNNASGDDLSGEDPDNGPETDDQLVKTMDILDRLHKQYYSPSNNEPNRRSVPEILRGIRHQVLAGAKLVLSGLVPLHKQNMADGSAKPRPAVVRYAESMGAVVMPSVKNGVTHVVAAKDGTDKTIAARKLRSCVVVKASWLMECIWSLRREDEAHHLLGPVVRPDRPSNATEASMDSKKEGSSTSSSEDDDDWAAAFESELMESES
jgi:RNA polymerase II subunit A-like phosphatase